MNDPYFRVEVVSATPLPQTVIYQALHQDYSEGFVWDEPTPSEEKCGAIAVQRLLAGNRGHYGPLENPQIILNCGWFPHSTMQQIRTHRHLSFDVQSGRYTGQRIIDVVEGKRKLEAVFYLRPVGEYSDRQGKRYTYSQAQRNDHYCTILAACERYKRNIDDGLSEEHARGLIPFDVRQHWVMSANMRSLMHLLAVRGKADAQLECQQLCELILPHFQWWAPQIYEWFMENQWRKGRLAP